MNVKLVEDFKIYEEYYVFDSSKFNEDKILIVESCKNGTKIIQFDRKNKKLTDYKFDEIDAYEFYILDDFSIFTYCIPFNQSIIINTETYEFKILINHDKKDIFIFCRTKNPNLLIMKEILDNKIDASYYVLDVKNNVFIENIDILKKNPNLYTIDLYTENKEQFYIIEENKEIYNININKEIKKYSYMNFFIDITAITTNKDLLIAVGIEKDNPDEKLLYEDDRKKANEVNIIIWNKNSTKIINTINYNYYTYDTCLNLYYFEKFNCLFLNFQSEILLYELSNEKFIFKYKVCPHALYVDEKNNKFGFYDDNTQSYKIYELVEE